MMPDTKDKQIKEQKKAAAVMAAGELRDGMVAGLGTGTTVYYLIQEIARLVKEGLTIHVLPTSEQTRSLASQLNLPLLSTDTAPAGDSSMDYREKSALLKSLTGVVETGLFPDFCEKLIIGGADGVRVLENR
ncbi:MULTISPECIES: hypothetical protein [Hungatella]|nr:MULTISPECIES: hypothetical protein [Hungatella]MCD7998635.1 hypothetical protein [Clostridiales bacterium]MCQ4831914.1 hypothetical protein [Hungatella sp. SL.1.14]CUQ59181.1 ribose 5-phosphate isomerase [Hungatella hathewayi]